MRVRSLNLSPDRPWKIETRRISSARPRSSGIDPRLFLSSYLPTIEVVEARGRNGHREIIRRTDLPIRFQKDEIRLGWDPHTDQEIVILREAYEEHRVELYRHESTSALRLIEANFPEQKLERDLFLQAEELVFRAKDRPTNLRHLSFMLRVAAESGADYLAAAAILVHNLEDTTIRTGLMLGKKSKATRIIAIDKLLRTKRITKHLIDIPYLPPTEGKMPQDYIEKFMNGFLKVTEGDGYALLLSLAHKYSDLMSKETIDPLVLRSVEELLAPLAERFGKNGLAQGLRNQAFRIANPELYRQIENDLAERAGMSREEGQLFLDSVAVSLRSSKRLADYDPIHIHTRFKLPWEAQQKTENKPDSYPSVKDLQDILGGMAVTDKPLTLEAAMEAAQEAVGDNFEGFNFKGRQTETKREKIGDETIEFHHVSIKLKAGKFMEFQFMDKKSYEIRERGERAHFVYKIPHDLDQVFDPVILEKCRRLMNGDLAHDVKAIYDSLSAWTYLFFFDQHFDGTVLRVLPRRVDPLPIEAAPKIIGKDLSNYGGVRVKKIWEWKDGPFHNISDYSFLHDGDLVDVKVGPGLDKIEAHRLFGMIKHPLARILLFYFNNQKVLEADARQGEILLKDLARQRKLTYNRIVLISFAIAHGLTPQELYAACQSRIIKPDLVLQALATAQNR